MNVNSIEKNFSKIEIIASQERALVPKPAATYFTDARIKKIMLALMPVILFTGATLLGVYGGTGGLIALGISALCPVWPALPFYYISEHWPNIDCQTPEGAQKIKKKLQNYTLKGFERYKMRHRVDLIELAFKYGFINENESENISDLRKESQNYIRTDLMHDCYNPKDMKEKNKNNYELSVKEYNPNLKLAESEKMFEKVARLSDKYRFQFYETTGLKKPSRYEAIKTYTEGKNKLKELQGALAQRWNIQS